jgi:hypothetical protein
MLLARNSSDHILLAHRAHPVTYKLRIHDVIIMEVVLRDSKLIQKELEILFSFMSM